MRYVTTFRWRLWIITYFQQWDTDKYTNLALQAHNDYMQAFKSNGLALEHTLALNGIMEEHLTQYRQDELEYL